MPRRQLFQAKCASWFSPSEGSSLPGGILAALAVAREVENDFRIAFPRVVVTGTQYKAKDRKVFAQWVGWQTSQRPSSNKDLRSCQSPRGIDECDWTRHETYAARAIVEAHGGRYGIRLAYARGMIRLG